MNAGSRIQDAAKNCDYRFFGGKKPVSFKRRAAREGSFAGIALICMYTHSDRAASTIAHKAVISI
ncbi:uncharacterized protein N7443_008218 [Penicillium atrosanguineum]|uniref:uncharacterized protein n=1 Tax=Penicillium atrosanguineum TaxID=1132637 RepID=UPI0023A5D06F|nr:uncharacterized protein N7443_008218 [Penicillium atrosanguineum]KAJ5292265.1 hypothetical protein N7443_008218 [Penicillium atrosanguineum]